MPPSNVTADNFSRLRASEWQVTTSPDPEPYDDDQASTTGGPHEESATRKRPSAPPLVMNPPERSIGLNASVRAIPIATAENKKRMRRSQTLPDDRTHA